MSKAGKFAGAAVVMGVASCGKTAVGKAIAELLDVPFTEGDRLHPSANIAKMSAGVPLTDEDRWPWLELVGQSLRGAEGALTSCSALKRAYREHIAGTAGRPVSFVLLDGRRAVLERRILERKGHFMPASLLESQLATLERPGPDECALRLDIEMPVEFLAAEAAHWLLKGTD